MIRWAFAAGLILAAGLCIGAPASAADDVLARDDGTKLTRGDVTAILQRLDPAQRQQVLSDRTRLIDLIRTELGRRAILDAAHKAHWEKRPDVAARIAQTSADIIVSTWLQAHTASTTDFPDESLERQVYQANLPRFMQPRQYHLAQIFVNRPDGASVEAIAALRDRALHLAQTARQGGAAQFSGLARKSSDDSESAGQGGDLGWVAESAIIPAVAAAIQGMSDGDISPPIEAKDGWHIVRVIGSIPAGPRSFESVKSVIADSLRQDAAERQAITVVDDMLASRHAAINTAALQTLLQTPAASTSKR